MSFLLAGLRAVLRGYAAILLSDRLDAGLLVLAAALCLPFQGACGLVLACAVSFTAQRLRLAGVDAGLYACNGALVGLFLVGRMGWTGPRLAALMVLALLGTLMLTTLLITHLWRTDRLPALSLPFVLSTWILMAVLGTPRLTTPASLQLPGGLIAMVSRTGLDGFLTALGALICAPQILPGALILLALLRSSRILVLLAAGAWALVKLSLAWGLIAASPTLLGFNAILVAMALGGVFLSPSFGSLVVAVGGLITAGLIVGVGAHVLPSGWPLLALPFAAGTLLVLGTLRQSPVLGRLILDRPALPERNLERARLAAARGVDPHSVPLRAPFFGAWQVYQGFDGPHTHREAWRHALDFFIHDGTGSFSGHGRELTDYHCFGLPVLAPISGVVESCRDDLADVPPGEVDPEHNWGNHVLIRLPSGLFVLLAHLRQGSLQVGPGAFVEAGTHLGHCGSSGRSPQPHLHLHVQTGPALGSPTHPFHLSGVLWSAATDGATPPQHQFRLHLRPQERDTVAPATPSPALLRSFQFQSGQQLIYTLHTANKGAYSLRHLRVEQDLEGTFRITADSGATAAFLRTEAVFACFDRNEVRDPFLDVWLLALGFTPLSAAARQWTDRPSARLLPGPRWRHAGLALVACHVLGLRSRYRRQIQADGCLRQTGLHHHAMGLLPLLTTRATISPERGLVKVQGRSRNQRWVATLVAADLRNDAMTIPAFPTLQPAEVHP